MFYTKICSWQLIIFLNIDQASCRALRDLSSFLSNWRRQKGLHIFESHHPHTSWTLNVIIVRKNCCAMCKVQCLMNNFGDVSNKTAHSINIHRVCNILLHSMHIACAEHQLTCLLMFYNARKQFRNTDHYLNYWLTLTHVCEFSASSFIVGL
jgi:hypothetical protein